jgi:general secretion pathway protein K
MAIEGMTWAIYQQLAPLVTIWPDDGGKINIHTAPAQVLQALPGGEQLEPKTASEVQMLVEQRDRLGFGSVDEVLQDPFFTENDRTTLQPLLTEKTSTFLLMAEASVAERPQQLYSVISRNNGQFRVLIRVQGASL